MLDLLETVAGLLLLVVYVLGTIVLPVLVLIAFVGFVGAALRPLIDRLDARVPERIREIRVARPAAAVAGVVVPYAIGGVLLLFLAAVSTRMRGGDVMGGGVLRLFIALAALQDVIAYWMTGYGVTDMLVLLQPPPDGGALAPLDHFARLTASHLYSVLEPGITLTAFRYTFAATVVVVGTAVIAGGAFALIRRGRVLRSTSAAAFAGWVGVVTTDTGLANTLQLRLERTGYAVATHSSLAAAFAAEPPPAFVLVDALDLGTLAPELLPPMYSDRLVAVTHDRVGPPVGWAVDTYRVESGAAGLAFLIHDRRAREARHA